MTTPREEFRAALDLLEEAVTQMSLIIMTLRRLEEELWPVEANPEREQRAVR